MTQPDKLMINDLQEIIKNHDTALEATLAKQLVEVMRENKMLRKAMQTIPRNSLSCHIETHLLNALYQHKDS